MALGSFTAKLLTVTSGLALAAAVHAKEEIVYRYDALGRLTTTTSTINDASPVNTVIKYDKAGNRETFEVGGSGTTDPGPTTPPTFHVRGSEANEGGNFQFVVTRSGSTAGSYSVNYASSHNTTDDNDYTPVTGTLNFTAGQTTQTISIPVTADGVAESYEYMWMKLSDPLNKATFVEGGLAGGLINPSAAVTPPTFHVRGSEANEGGNFQFVVTRSGSTAGSYSVKYASSHNTTDNNDYTPVTGTLNFTAGQTTQTISIPVTADGVEESYEYMWMKLSDPLNKATFVEGGLAGGLINPSAAVTPPTFHVRGSEANEGGNFQFVVTRSGSTAGSYSVNYASSHNTTDNNDYTPVTGTLNFTAGQTTQTISIPVTADGVAESYEYMWMKLFDPLNKATFVEGGLAGGLINPSVAAPAFHIRGVEVNEGQTAQFVVSRSHATGYYTVDYQSSHNDTDDGDYAPVSGTLTFAEGQSAKSIFIPIIADGVAESWERMSVMLSNPSGGATISTHLGGGLINPSAAGTVPTTNTTPPTFSITGASGSEGSNLTFTVERSGNLSGSHSVNYATSNGSATAGSDYTAQGGPLTFADGQAYRTINILATSDNVAEPEETLVVSLTNPTSGAVITQATGKINPSGYTPPSAGNQPPVANADSGIMNKCTTKSFTVLTNDTDPENTTLTLVSVNYPGRLGSASVSGSSISFAPNNNAGITTVGYTIRDEDLKEATGVLNLEIGDGRCGATGPGGPDKYTE
ncbi:MAG TPA: Calx-beta domain-containing protein [Allosphingosinicella sp.]